MTDPKTTSPGEDSARAGFADRWWTAPDGARLHARDYTGAPGKARRPVFGLHGLTRNARDFEDLAPRIAATGRRVLAFDVRGRGLSDASPDTGLYTPLAYAADLEGWAQALGISRADVIGTSMGGLIAMTLALTAPGLLGEVVLNDIGPEIGAGGLSRILAYVGVDPGVDDWAGAAAWAKAQNGASFPSYAPPAWDAFARRLFREEGGRPVLDYDTRIAEPIRAAAEAATKAADHAEARGEAPPPAPDLWPAFNALCDGRRVLVLRGDRSDLLSPETVARMREVAPRIEVVEVKGVGHAPMLDEPEALAAILAWLEPTPA